MVLSVSLPLLLAVPPPLTGLRKASLALLELGSDVLALKSALMPIPLVLALGLAPALLLLLVLEEEELRPDVTREPIPRYRLLEASLFANSWLAGIGGG